MFTNASLGWPAGLSLNLPSGGPSPPLAALGARLRADITDNLTVLGAIFNGDSAGWNFRAHYRFVPPADTLTWGDIS
ncbi:hypothetical protein ABIG04_005815 [Bradyrhizobium japonicum]